MVWLAKWIRENITGARMLIITDRTELDEQIEKVFKGVHEQICRTKSGTDLIEKLNSTSSIINRQMNMRLFPFITALVLSLIPLTGWAICQRNEPEFLWNYAGDMNNKIRIKMTLIFSGNEITGQYVYASQLKDIPIKGRVVDDKTFILDELDEDGKPSARFTGEFPKRDPRGIYGESPLSCDVMVGSWQKTNAQQALPFYLQLADSTVGSLDHRYRAAGVDNDDLIHRQATRFWEAVRREDKKTAAVQIKYPIKISLNGKDLLIANAKAFIQHYDDIITPATRKAILDDIPRYMFVRSEGIMLANGIVWLGADGRVISLASLPKK